MQIILSAFEIDTLNKFIHTQTFEELNDLQNAISEYLNLEKENLIHSGITLGMDFNSFVTQTTEHICNFLVENEFFHARDGGVYFLTEKGKQLKAQQTWQKYLVWESEHNHKLIEEMHTIQRKGYLDREQPTREELTAPPADKERKSNLVYYILIVAALIVFYLIGKHHKFN